MRTWEKRAGHLYRFINVDMSKVVPSKQRGQVSGKGRPALASLRRVVRNKNSVQVTSLVTDVERRVTLQLAILRRQRRLITIVVIMIVIIIIVIATIVIAVY